MKVPAADHGSLSLDEVWQAILGHFPPDTELERRARDSGAIVRFRGVKSASDLLRVALTYSFCGLSMKATGAWLRKGGTACLSKWAVLNRLRNCADWLESLVAYKLGRRVSAPPVSGMTVRLVDATRIALPGSKGATWKVHACYDPWSGQLSSVCVTDNHGGERLDRFTFEPGDVVVADQAYAHRRGLAHVSEAGGRFVIRTNWKHAPLEAPDGAPFDLFEALRGLSGQKPGEFSVRLQADKSRGLPAIECRLIAQRKTPEAAEAAKTKARREAEKKKATLDPRTLEGLEYIMVLTTVEREVLDTSRILALYRLRWQIELEFKRLKSLLDLDELRTRDPDTVRAVVAAKLLGALVIEELAAGADKGGDWSFTQLLATSLKQAILGMESVRKCLLAPRSVAEWLTEPPRKRQLQREATRALLLAPS